MSASPRRLLPIAVVLLLPACGGAEGAVLRGTLRDPASAPDTVHARTAAGESAIPMTQGAFEVPGAGGSVALRIGGARMEVAGLPEEGTVELRGVRLDTESGLAFPGSVAVPGGGIVTVNGLRYGGSVPARVEADGTVLAASDSRDALLVRPGDAALPDLRVVVGPLTETVTPDGDPVAVEALEPGDSVRVEGGTEGGYVVASRIVVPRRAALRERAAVQARREPAAADRSAPEESRAERAEPERREEKGEGRGKGKGRGGERGKGGGKKGKG
ncbi:MAG TPA: hypothetical protein VF263_25375 [Longimicrobiaceae bacterium]